MKRLVRVILQGRWRVHGISDLAIRHLRFPHQLLYDCVRYFRDALWYLHSYQGVLGADLRIPFHKAPYQKNDLLGKGVHGFYRCGDRKRTISSRFFSGVGPVPLRHRLGRVLSDFPVPFAGHAVPRRSGTSGRRSIFTTAARFDWLIVLSSTHYQFSNIVSNRAFSFLSRTLLSRG